MTARYRRMYDELRDRGLAPEAAQRQVQTLYDLEQRQQASGPAAAETAGVAVRRESAMARGASPMNAQRSAIVEALMLRRGGSQFARSFAPEGTRVDQTPSAGATVSRVDSAPTLARLAAQGATFGLSDEIRGAAATIGALATAGRPGGMRPDRVVDAVTGRTYRDARDAERAALTKARQADGTMVAGAELAGGAAAAVPGAARTLARAGGDAAARMLAGGKVGAQAGALGGFGASESGVDDLAGLARDVAIGAGAGGAVGALGTGAATLLARGAEAAVPAVSRATAAPRAALRGQLATATPASALEGVSPRAMRRAVSAFAEDLAPRGTPEDALAELGRRAGRMEPTEMLMDQGGPNVRGLVAAAEATPGPGRSLISGAIAGRQRTQAKRATRTLAEFLGLRPSGDLVGEAAARAEALRREAQPIYQRAMFTEDGAPRTIDARLFEVHAGKPAFRRALNEATELAANDGVQLPASIVEGVQAPNGGVRMVLVNPTLEQAHYVKVALDAAAERAARTSPSEARIIRRVARDFRESLYGAVPDYREAQAMWATAERQREALEKGAGALRKSRAEIRRDLEAMSEPEQLLYRTQALDDLRAMVGRLAEDRDAVRQLTTPEMRGRLLALSPDRTAFKRLRRWMEGEVRQAQTRAATAGSRTVPLANDQAALSEGFMPSRFVRGVQMAVHPLKTAQDASVGFARWLDMRGRSQLADELAPVLTARRDQAPAAMSALMDALLRQRFGDGAARTTSAMAGAAGRGSVRGLE